MARGYTTVCCSLCGSDMRVPTARSRKDNVCRRCKPDTFSHPDTAAERELDRATRARIEQIAEQARAGVGVPTLVRPREPFSYVKPPQPIRGKARRRSP